MDSRDQNHLLHFLQKHIRLLLLKFSTFFHSFFDSLAQMLAVQASKPVIMGLPINHGALDEPDPGPSFSRLCSSNNLQEAAAESELLNKVDVAANKRKLGLKKTVSISEKVEVIDLGKMRKVSSFGNNDQKKTPSLKPLKSILKVGSFIRSYEFEGESNQAWPKD